MDLPYPTAVGPNVRPITLDEPALAMIPTKQFSVGEEAVFQAARSRPEMPQWHGFACCHRSQLWPAAGVNLAN
jgi:hypothetical protein